MNTQKKQQGFSLIELLVVVAIIGILAAAGVVGYQNYTETARQNVAASNQGAIVQYVRTLGQSISIGLAQGAEATACEEANPAVIGDATDCAAAIRAKLLADGFGPSVAAGTTADNEIIVTGTLVASDIVITVNVEGRAAGATAEAVTIVQ